MCAFWFKAIEEVLHKYFLRHLMWWPGVIHLLARMIGAISDGESLWRWDRRTSKIHPSVVSNLLQRSLPSGCTKLSLPPSERTEISSTVGCFGSYQVWREENNSLRSPAGEHRYIRPFYQRRTAQTIAMRLGWIS